MQKLCQIYYSALDDYSIYHPLIDCPAKHKFRLKNLLSEQTFPSLMRKNYEDLWEPYSSKYSGSHSVFLDFIKVKSLNFLKVWKDIGNVNKGWIAQASKTLRSLREAKMIKLTKLSKKAKWILIEGNDDRMARCCSLFFVTLEIYSDKNLNIIFKWK